MDEMERPGHSREEERFVTVTPEGFNLVAEQTIGCALCGLSVSMDWFRGHSPTCPSYSGEPLRNVAVYSIASAPYAYAPLEGAKPSTAAGLEGDCRDISGETVMGMRVPGWRWKTPIPAELQGEKWAYSYASHYSTGPKNSERLFAEIDVRRILAARPAQGQESALREEEERLRLELEASRYDASCAHHAQRYSDDRAYVAEAALSAEIAAHKETQASLNACNAALTEGERLRALAVAILETTEGKAWQRQLSSLWLRSRSGDGAAWAALMKAIYPSEEVRTVLEDGDAAHDPNHPPLGLPTRARGPGVDND